MKPGGARFDDEAENDDARIVPLSAEEARELRKRQPQVSPWRVIAAQVVTGVVVAVAALLVTGSAVAAWSAAYGALAVAVPAAVFARGLTGRLASLNPGTALLGFFVWEMVKMALTAAMLIAAPRLVVPLNWPAMLVGLAAAMQMYWVALAFVSGRKKN